MNEMLQLANLPDNHNRFRKTAGVEVSPTTSFPPTTAGAGNPRTPLENARH
jgi:hypothetical protein